MRVQLASKRRCDKRTHRGFIYFSLLVILLSIPFPFPVKAAPPQPSTVTKGTNAARTNALQPGITFQALSERLLGVLLPPNHPLSQPVKQLLEKGDIKGAARKLTEDPRFLDIKVRDLAAQYTNKDENPNVEFDDLQALFIGMTRDGTDAGELLTADYRYEKPPAGSRPTRESNSHYQSIDRSETSVSQGLVKTSPQWDGFLDAAGALTTYSFARAHFFAGTNRLPVKYALKEFLCRDPEQWRQLDAPDDWVRRDVDRLPSGKGDLYQADCRGCHSGMDALSGAFAYFDFTDKGFIISNRRKGIVKKYSANDHVYPEGRAIHSTAWKNYLTQGHNEEIGWVPPLEGQGVKSLGAMLSRTKAFNECLAERVFRHVCRQKEPSRTITRLLAEDFSQGGRKIAQLFIDSATHPECGGQP